MEPIRDIVGRWSPRAVAWGGALAAVVPLLGTIAAQGVGDLLLVALSAGGGLGAGWLYAERRRLDALPLELSGVALRDLVDGVPAIKIRARLGRGRVAREPEAEFVWLGPDGEHPLPVIAPADVVSGAFTYLAFDRARITAGPGALRVRARVRGGSAVWEAERTFERLDDGRFAPPVVRHGGRLRHDRGAWDKVEA